ncbi:MAG: tRNA (adenosine(37)-N6)-dimethylallyltransferase MiaA [Bacteroidota bacterium]
MKFLLVIGGPTASGKTNLAIALAKHYNAEIISADSRQFYREMNIGTARPTAEELVAAKHHFIADRSVTQPLSAGQYAKEATELLNAIYEKHDYAILVGGSGLFIRALCEGLDHFPIIPDSVKQKVQTLYEEKGLAGLQTALQLQDPTYYATVDQQNPVRLQRALEVGWAAGKPYSFYLGKKTEQRIFYPIYLQPSWSRAVLYDRINRRVDQMVATGLEEEARALWPQQHLAALQTVGYQEWFAHFEGKMDWAETIAMIKQNTRRYAKRQLTWNRRDGHWKLVPKGDLEGALQYIQLILREDLRLGNLEKTDGQIIAEKENYFGVGLLDKHEQYKGSIQGVKLKEWAFIYSCELEDLSYHAAMILLHEALERAERPVVYIQAELNTTILHTKMGWKEVNERSSLPPKMKAALKADVPVLKWERKDFIA